MKKLKEVLLYMRPNKRPLIFLLLVTLLLSVFLLVACSEGGQAVEVTRVVTQEVEVPGRGRG